MNTIDFVRDQLGQARQFFEGTMADVTDAEAHALPPGTLNPIAATYAHLVTGEDGFVHALLRNEAPLFATAWSGKTGLSELPPDGAAWNEWGRGVTVALPQLRQYAAAVAGATDAWLQTLRPADLDREIDLSSFGLGERTLGWVIGAGVIGHVQSHWGEICALKGLHGGKGFPF